MRRHEHDAAVEQRQPRDGKPWVLTYFVRAVAIDHRRRRQLEPGAMDDRQRNPDAVRSDRPIPPLEIGKPWVLTYFVRAVAIDHRRRRQLEPGAMDDRQRNPDAVRSDRPIPPL